MNDKKKREAKNQHHSVIMKGEKIIKPKKKI